MDLRGYRVRPRTGRGSGRKGGWGLVRVPVTLILLAVVCLMSGCSGGLGSAKVVFTTGLGPDEVFHIGQATCSLAEAQVYLTTTKNQYEAIFGKEIWENPKIEARVKDNVLASLAQMKTMSLMAEKKGIQLSEGEKAAVKQAAGTYFDSLNESEKEAMGVSLTAIETLYEQALLSDKVYALLIEGVNPEISDDEARTVKVAYIFIGKGRADGAKMAEALRKKAVEDGANFMSLAAENTHASSTTLSLRREEEGVDGALVAGAFELATEEVSPVIETQEGFYVLKCLSTLDREETDANKIRLVEGRRKAVFAKEYDAFVADLPRQMNEDLWQNTGLIRESDVSTSDFFEIYSKYVGIAPGAD